MKFNSAANRFILLLKMYVDRRRNRGASAWSFRWLPWSGSEGYHEIEVRSRCTREQATLRLRKGTTDLLTFEQIYCNNDYDTQKLVRNADIRAIYMTQLESGTPVILDLGANCGMAATFFRLSWPSAHVIAVEPEPANFAALQLNASQLSEIECVRAAVASFTGLARIVNPLAESWAVQTEIAEKGETDGTVRAVSIPELLSAATARGGIPFICKIDIEGFESELFCRGTSWIDQFPLIIIELHDWMLPRKATSQNFLQAISTRNRDFVYVGENVFSIRNTGSQVDDS